VCNKGDGPRNPFALLIHTRFSVTDTSKKCVLFGAK
jgi:hypothetical protein